MTLNTIYNHWLNSLTNLNGMNDSSRRHVLLSLLLKSIVFLYILLEYQTCMLSFYLNII